MTLIPYAPNPGGPLAGRPGPKGWPPDLGQDSGRGRDRPAAGSANHDSSGAGAGRRGPGRRLLILVLPAADLLAVALATAITGPGPIAGACYGLALLTALAMAGLYRERICLRVSDGAGRAAASGALAALALLPWTSAGSALRLAGCAAVLVLGLRAAVCAGLREAHRRGLLVQPALIIGTGQPGAELARLLREHPELGLRPCGVLNDRPAGSQDAETGLPLLGRLREASAVVARHGVTQVLACLPAADDTELVAALRACRDLGSRVSILPSSRQLGLAVPRWCLDDIWGVPLIPLRGGTDVAAQRAAKRVLDLTAGSLLLVASAPLLLLLALAVWLDLRMPPVFRQVRVVGKGRLATIAKLRTLHPAGDPDTAWVVTPGQSSALGKLLRASHLDELPQLVSVLRGQMSLVGPRPERPYFARQLAADVTDYADRERTSAGLTGWAQVHGLTGDTSIEDRARFDNCYIEYWSIWLDLLILARTVPAALAGVVGSARGGTS